MKLIKLYRNLNRGMTLLELLVTVSIIAVLLGVGLTAFTQSINQQNANDAVEQAALAIRNARSYARLQGVVVELDFQTDSYGVKVDNVPVTDHKGFGHLSGTFPKNVKILSKSCSSMFFQPDGALVDSSQNVITNNCTITIGSTSSDSRTLTINPNTGKVIYD